MSHLLEVIDLEVKFALRFGDLTAINGVNFTLDKGERLGIVGESGAGKSVTGFAIINLLSKPGYISAGKILFEDRELNRLPEEEMRRIRGNRIGMIFQDPMMTLNPVLTIGTQMVETVLAHHKVGKKEATAIALEKLHTVRIPSPAKRLHQYPHELSGGMRQRIVVAIALLTNPVLIIADEPTTALDVTIQAQVLALLDDLKNDMKMSMIFITHDMGVVARVADRVAVMYGGYLVEVAPVEELFANPTHPYTEALLKSMPRLDRDIGTLNPIPGLVPSIDKMPQGCRFAERCRYKMAICEQQMPELSSVNTETSHSVRCWVRGTQKNSNGGSKA